MVRIGWEPPLELGRKAEPALGATRLRGELAFLGRHCSRRSRGIGVSTVSNVCAIKVRVPVRAEDGLDPLHVDRR